MKTLTKLYAPLLGLALLASCNEADQISLSTTQPSTSTIETTSTADEAEITEIQATPKSFNKDDYFEAPYSSFVLFHKDGQKVLIDYDFFPEESDLCQQATFDADINPNGCKVSKTIVIPCEKESIEQNDDEFLSIGINAPLNDTPGCQDDIILDLSLAQFTLEGLEFEFQDSLDVFKKDFGFELNQKNVLDSRDNSPMDLDDNQNDLDQIKENLSDKKS